MHKAKSCAPEGADAPNFLGRSALEGQREGLGALFLGPLRPMYLCIHIYIYGTPPQKNLPLSSSCSWFLCHTKHASSFEGGRATYIYRYVRMYVCLSPYGISVSL